MRSKTIGVCTADHHSYAPCSIVDCSTRRPSEDAARQNKRRGSCDCEGNVKQESFQVRGNEAASIVVSVQEGNKEQSGEAEFDINREA